MWRSMRKMVVWLWVVWASGSRRRRDAERGSQSLEWVGLGVVVMAIMFGAAQAVKDGGLGAALGSALAGFIRTHIPQ